jgi:hypothetical protein
MSGTVRAGLVFGLAAALAVTGSALLPIPCLSLISVIALGVGAGYTAAKTTAATREQRIGRGVTAGAIGGLIALVGSAIGLFFVYSIPTYQQQFQPLIDQMLQQTPELEDLGIDLGILLAATVGFCSGIINFFLMLISGLLGGLFWKGAPGAAATGAQGYGSTGYGPGGGPGYSPPGDNYPDQPSGYGDRSTGRAEDNVRIYDPDDRNRT